MADEKTKISKNMGFYPEKNKDMKRNFYDFRNIYKIEDFFCFSDNSSYINLQGNNSKSKSSLNSNQILSSFRKNISSYLIVKKHYESTSNKYFTLVSKLKSYQDKNKNSASLNRLLTDENNEQIIEEKNSHRNEVSINNQLPLDFETFNNMKKSNEIFIKCDFIADHEGDQKRVVKKISLNKLESKFIKKYENLFNNPEKPKEHIIEQLTKDYEKIINKIQNTRFLVKYPKNMKPSMQDFNEYYFYSEEENLTPEIKIEERNFQEENKAIAEEFFFEEILKIPEDEIKNNEVENNNAEIEKEKIQEPINNQESINNKVNEEFQQKNEDNLSDKSHSDSDEDEDNYDEEEEHYEPNSHKVLEKMKKNINSKKKTKNNKKQPKPHILKKPNLNDENKTSEPNELISEKDIVSVSKSEKIVNFKDKNDEGEKEMNQNPNEVEDLLIKVANENKEEEKENTFDANEIKKSSKMNLIERLLVSNDIFSEDLSEMKPINFNYPKIPDDLKFSDENEKEIFQKIFYWLYEVELQVEKDKNDIQNYQQNYHMKFLDFLKNEQLDKEEEDDEEESKSSGSSFSENDEEDYESESDK